MKSAEFISLTIIFRGGIFFSTVSAFTTGQYFFFFWQRKYYLSWWILFKMISCWTAYLVAVCFTNFSTRFYLFWDVTNRKFEVTCRRFGTTFLPHFHRRVIPYRISERNVECPPYRDVKKVKVTLVQALRFCTGRTAHSGSRGIALPFHDDGTRNVWGVIVMPRPLFTTRKNPAPIVHESGWAPGPVWTCAENLVPIGIRSPDRPAPSAVAIPNALPGPQTC